MVTLNILTEQINRLYSRYLDRDNKKLDDREVKLHISQAINSLFKIEIVNGFETESAIATYEELSKKDETHYVDLPISPVSLPKNQGIWRVYQTGCPWQPYVPIRSGDFDIMQGTATAFIEGHVGYYQDGMKIRFTQSVPEKITLKLIVNDPGKAEGNDPLPIPRDMETKVIQAVFELLGVGQLSQSELNSKSERVINNERER